MTVRTAVMLTLLGLVAVALPAQAQIPNLIEDLRWGEMSVREAPEADLSQRKTLMIPTLPSAPALDGDLRDPAWEAAAQTDTWMTNTGEAPAPVQTTTWAGLHDGRLYVAVRAEEPNIDGLLADVTEEGGPVWEDDVFEMFVDGNLDLTTVNQLLINPLGTVSTLTRGGTWQPEVQRGASIGEDAWFAEFSLSLDDLGITGADFGVNFCRERRASGDLQLSCWSPTGGAFNEPGRFGLASLPGGYLKVFSVGRGVLGQNSLSATISNPADQPQALSARLAWWQGEGIAVARTIGPWTLAPGESREISFGYDIQRTGEPVELELAILGPQRNVVAQRQVTQEIADVMDLIANRRLVSRDGDTMTVRGVFRITSAVLERSRVVLALFDDAMALRARDELAPSGGAMRAELKLPALEAGPHTLHLVLKSGPGEDARRVAEEKITLYVLPDRGTR